MKTILYRTIVSCVLAISITGAWADSNETHNFINNSHIAGYADVSYEDTDNGTAGFNALHFNPIFHFQMNRKVFFEAELETEVDGEGETEVKLEYSDINVYLNDNLTLVGGLFLSPLGYFRQNLHPSWVNKMVTAPPGFGHDGAAPSSDLGLQLRGAHSLGQGSRLNYAVYTANGPRLEVVAGEIHGIAAEGATSNADNSLVTGGRVAYLPVPNFEIGLSAASGNVAIDGESTRDYTVAGADFNWQVGGFDLKGEYIESEVGELASSISPESAKWSSGYIQAAYRWLPSNWETAVRYTNFDSPHPDDDQKQSAISMNYYLYANAVIKLMYAANDGEAGSASDDDQILAQIAYGF